MLEFLFGRGAFLPHGYCFTWTPGLLWTLVGADALISASYFSIPLAIWRFARLRAEPSLTWVYGLFAAFIFACGTTHVMDIWTIWRPDYGLQALSKTMTALISVTTAVALWPLLPRALKIPSVGKLQGVIQELQAEVQRRREAERQAVDVEQSLMATLASIDAGILATDREGRITRMNPLAERVTGWARSDALGLPLRQVWDRENVPADVARQNPVDFVISMGMASITPHLAVVNSRAGARTPVIVRASLIHDHQGTVSGLALVFRDRSELVEAEAENARLAAIVASSTDAIIGETLSGQITDWNDAAQTLFGYAADEAVGQPIEMLIPEDRLHEEARIVAQLARGASVAPFQTIRLRRDGSKVDVSVSVSPIRDSRGRVIGAAKIARDVSAQKAAEAALRASEARLRFVLDAARIGDWELDLVTGVSVRSLQHDRCFGYPEPITEWGYERFLAHVHPGDREAVKQSYETALAQRAPWHCRCRVIWPSGSVHWLDIHGALRFDDSRAVSLLGVVTDITHEKLAVSAQRAAERLESENRRIEAANRAKSAFLANMSHELRTPLNAIIGFADLLASGMVPPGAPEYQTFTGHIASSGKHLLQLINDILDLSKVEAGRLEFRPQAIDLNQVVAQVLEMLALTASRRKLRLRTELDPSIGAVTLDEARLKQVLYNYLSNAIKFTPEGGEVIIRAYLVDPEHFVLEVQDSGVGIAADDMPRLFNDFVQLSDGASKAHQGTGLGLALTKRLVQAQGGHVGVRSEVGKGSVFWARLNVHHGTDAPLAPAQGGGDMGVLIVHEDEAVIQAAAAVLQPAGYTVTGARSSNDAVTKASQEPYAALSLSLSLPGRPGLEVLEAIRRDTVGASRYAPVLGLTIDSGLTGTAGFAVADVVAKPIDTHEVVGVIRRVTAGLLESPTILVVDDDPVAIQLMTATLQAIGVNVVGRTDSQDALEQLDAIAPDVIVLDLMMPHINGFEFLSRLSGVDRWRELPVVVWTAMALTPAEYRTLATAAQAVATKGAAGFENMLQGLKLAMGRFEGRAQESSDVR